MNAADYAPAVHWTVERDHYEDISDEVRYSSAYRYQVSTRVEQTQPAKKHRKVTDPKSLRAGFVLVAIIGALAGVATTAGAARLTHVDFRAAPKPAHVAPKPVPVKVYRFWINAGTSSLRIGV
jgi:hypothetical protein